MSLKWQLGILAVMAVNCGGESVSAPPSVARRTCSDTPAAAFGLRVEAAQEVAHGECGEVAVIDPHGALDFFAPETGARQAIAPRAAAMAFGANGERLVAIDDAGAEIVVIDTRTMARHVHSLSPAIGKVSRLGVLADGFFTCGDDALRFHSNDGPALRTEELVRCEDAIAGPRGSSVSFTVLRGEATPEIVVVHANGQRRVLPMLGGGELGEHEHVAAARGMAIQSGRFHAFYTETRTPCGDTDCFADNELVILDAMDGRELLRGEPTTGGQLVPREAFKLFEIDAGTLVPLSNGLAFVFVDGTVTKLGKVKEVLDVFDGPDGSARVVVRTEGSNYEDGPVVVLDARTGSTLRQLGDVQSFVHADGGETIAWSIRAPCIHYPSDPGVCHSDPHRVFVEVDGKATLLGYSPYKTAPLWVGKDGTVIVNDLFAGDPPAQLEPDEFPEREEGLFLRRLDGTRTVIDLKRWGYLDAVTDLRGEVVLLPRSVGPGEYGGPDAEVRGVAVVRIRDGQAEPLVKGLSEPSMHRTWRPGFAVVVDENKENPGAYDVFAGTLR